MLWASIAVRPIAIVRSLDTRRRRLLSVTGVYRGLHFPSERCMDRVPGTCLCRFSTCYLQRHLYIMLYTIGQTCECEIIMLSVHSFISVAAVKTCVLEQFVLVCSSMLFCTFFIDDFR